MTIPFFAKTITSEGAIQTWWSILGNEKLIVELKAISGELGVGGELHTFTKVATFGGGFIPPLNQLSGNPVPAPECLQPENATNIFVEAGTTDAGPTAGSAELPVGVSNWETVTPPCLDLWFGNPNDGSA